MRVVRRLFAAGLLALLCACASVTVRPPQPETWALTDTEGTALARIAAASRPVDAAGPSGFRLLPTGEFAFGARLALAQRAERSIDVQYYHLHRDHTGRALLRELRDAAARGVRVRLLVDDFYAAEVDDLLLDLAAHPNAAVRLFNPLPLRRGAPLVRLLLSPGEFERHNHRMHNKLLVADNAIAVYGGRNIADEYFMSAQSANFIDMDVLSTGAVVRDLSAVFDRYWNSEVAWPVEAVLGVPADAAAARARFDAAVRGATPPVAAYRVDPLEQAPVDEQLRDGRLALTDASARVHADSPQKAGNAPALGPPTAAMRGLLDTLALARSEAIIVSPYFLPGTVGMPMIRRAAQAGVHLVVVTNSLASTDEPAVHDRYRSYRVEMLRLGVELYEFDPAAVRRSRGFGLFGASTPRLHAKVAVVDRRHLVVGSVNLDGRSAVGNTEMSVAIDSPPLARQLGQLMGGGRYSIMHRLRLQPDGQTIEWVGSDAEGRPVVTADEPEYSGWLRFKLWLQSFFVEERLL